MKYRQLGQTGMQVSTIAMGCWAFGGGRVWGDQEDADSIAAVHAALDAGINLFDTAEGYGGGKSEEVLGQALAGRRSEAIIATKVSRAHMRREQVLEACEASLRRLGTDYVDLYQLHWPNWEVPFSETLGAVDELVRQGKVRAFGVSNFGVRDLADLAALRIPESNQLPYSLLWRAIEYGILDRCIEVGTGVLCYSPLSQGLLTGKWRTADEVPQGRNATRFYTKDRGSSRHGEEGQEELVFSTLHRIREICKGVGQPMADVSMAWLLQRPSVTSVLAGMRNVEQVRQNVAAVNLELADDVVQALWAATEDLKAAFGASPDMFQGESRYR